MRISDWSSDVCSSDLWSGSANVVVKLPVPTNLGTMDLRADFYGQTHTFFSSTNGTSTPGTRLDGYSTIALRYSWKDIMESNVSAALFVRHLTDKVNHISGYALAPSTAVPPRRSDERRLGQHCVTTRHSR